MLIACERSGEYRPKKKDLVRICTSSRKCECPFKLHAKPVLGGERRMVQLIVGLTIMEWQSHLLDIHMRVD